MKALLMTAVLALSAHVYADTTTPTTPAPTPTPMIYCDYNAATQQDSVFMDLYFTVDAASNTYQNLQVGFLNADNTGYPDYLYSVVVTPPEASSNVALVAVSKDANSLTFTLPATTVSVNGVDTTGFQIGVTDGKVNSFDVVANGTFNGQTLTNADFTCYDPSLLNDGSQSAIPTR